MGCRDSGGWCARGAGKWGAFWSRDVDIAIFSLNTAPTENRTPHMYVGMSITTREQVLRSSSEKLRDRSQNSDGEWKIQALRYLPVRAKPMAPD